jgi:hypothetical protein
VEARQGVGDHHGVRVTEMRLGVDVAIRVHNIF